MKENNGKTTRQQSGTTPSGTFRPTTSMYAMRRRIAENILSQVVQMQNEPHLLPRSTAGRLW
jgi:hypothetical protein